MPKDWWGGDVLVSGEPVGTVPISTYNAAQRNIEVCNDTVHVVWESYGIWYDGSTDDGISFGEPVRVDDGGVSTQDATLCLARDGTIYVVWCDKRDGDGPDYNIYLSRSVDGGNSFSQDVRVDDAGDDASRQWEPAVATDDSGRVYMV